MQIQLIKNAKSKAATEKLKIDRFHCFFSDCWWDQFLKGNSSFSS